MGLWMRLYCLLAGPERKRRAILKRVRTLGPADLNRALCLGGGLPGLLFSFLASTRSKRYVIARVVEWMDEERLDRVILSAARSVRRSA